MTHPDSPCVRVATEDDAARLLALRLALDAETTFMLLEADERSRDVAAQRGRLRAASATPNSATFLAEMGDTLVGFLQARGGEFRRNRHVVDIVVGVSEAWRGRGVARALFAATEAWAPARGVTRLELTAMAANTRAIRLYEALGFVVEGTKRAALRVDGHPVDELVMGKLLDEP